MVTEVQRFESFEEFFPYYCGEHRKPLTRWLHFLGTHAGGAVLATAVARRQPALIALAPVVSYGTAWVAHFFVEHNRPATFKHPLYSLRGDFAMMGMMWAGHDSEVQALADRATAPRPIVLAGAERVPAA